ICVNGYGPATITTGLGADTIKLDGVNYDANALIVTDFTTGAGGDVLNFDPVLANVVSGWDGSSNPFGSGFMRLVASGSDTLLQLDADGAANGQNYRTIVDFQHTAFSSFTSDNFIPPYNPDGGATPGVTFT